MVEIGKMEESELAACAWITGRANPVMRMDDAGAESFASILRERTAPGTGTAYLVARDESGPVAMARCIDFETYCEGLRVPMGGLASVAVDLGRKKEGLALGLVKAYAAYFRERGFSLLGLYPFRHDFYRSMGFGYGARLRRYSVRPSQIDAGGPKAPVDLLGPEDAPAMAACYEAYARARTGMTTKAAPEFEAILANKAVMTYGYRRGGELLAYTSFVFEPVRPDNYMVNDIRVARLFWTAPEGLRAIMGFYRSQADQIRLIHFEVQEEGFRHLLLDPADQSGNLHAKGFIQSCLEGDGIMWRVDDPAAFLGLLAEGGRRFGGGDLRLGLSLRDPLDGARELSFAVAIEGGRLAVLPHRSPVEAELSLSLADFSSMAMGAVALGSLVDGGLASLSDPAVLPRAEGAFMARRPPQCSTYF